MGGILAGTDHIHNKCQYVSPHQMTNTSMKQCMSYTDHSAIKLHLQRQMLNCLKMAFCVPKNWRLCAQGKSVQWPPIYGLKVGSFVVIVNIGQAPRSLGLFWSGNPTTMNMATVCFAISGTRSVCLATFTSLTTAAITTATTTTTTTGKCFCIPLYAVVFVSLSCSETVINVKEGLMKFRSKPCDALQREKNSKLKHSTKILMR